MCGQLYLDTMHADRADLIIRYLSIWWSDLETKHTIATVRISRSFLWYAMNELMHVMPEQINVCNARTIDACNAIMIFWVNEWSFQLFPLIKSWGKKWVSTHGKLVTTSGEGLLHAKYFEGVDVLLVLTFWTFFYFGPYIFILPLLVLETINVQYFGSCHQPTDEKSIRGWQRN